MSQCKAFCGNCTYFSWKPETNICETSFDADPNICHAGAVRNQCVEKVDDSETYNNTCCKEVTPFMLFSLERPVTKNQNASKFFCHFNLKTEQARQLKPWMAIGV